MCDDSRCASMYILSHITRRVITKQGVITSRRGLEPQPVKQYPASIPETKVKQTIATEFFINI